jgi:hypothetical protein
MALLSPALAPCLLVPPGAWHADLNISVDLELPLPTYIVHDTFPAIIGAQSLWDPGSGIPNRQVTRGTQLIRRRNHADAPEHFCWNRPALRSVEIDGPSHAWGRTVITE